MASMPLSDYGQLFEEKVESFSLSALKVSRGSETVFKITCVIVYLCSRLHACLVGTTQII
jgi:hypothetical protein